MRWLTGVYGIFRCESSHLVPAKLTQAVVPGVGRIRLPSTLLGMEWLF